MVAAQLMDRLTKTEAERNALRDEVADLRAQVEWFKRNLFGAGKSETLDALQTRLKLYEEAAQPEATAALRRGCPARSNRFQERTHQLRTS